MAQTIYGTFGEMFELGSRVELAGGAGPAGAEDPARLQIDGIAQQEAES